MKFRSLLLLVLFVAIAGETWARNAPDFTLSDSDGKQVTLSSFRGKYVVLEVLLVTCPHCQAAAKVLEKMQAEYPDQLQVLGVSTPGFGVVALSDYKREFGVTYPLLQGSWKFLMDYLGVSPARPQYQIPWFFVISPTGEILQEKNPDSPLDKSFYNNPDPAANVADAGDAWLQKSVESMIRQTLPKKEAAKPPVAKQPVRKAPAVKSVPDLGSYRLGQRS